MSAVNKRRKISKATADTLREIVKQLIIDLTRTSRGQKFVKDALARYKASNLREVRDEDILDLLMFLTS